MRIVHIPPISEVKIVSKELLPTFNQLTERAT